MVKPSKKSLARYWAQQNSRHIIYPTSPLTKTDSQSRVSRIHPQNLQGISRILDTKTELYKKESLQEKLKPDTIKLRISLDPSLELGWKLK